MSHERTAELKQLTDGKYDPDLALRWVAALESGTYVQGQKALHPSNDTFCCLGVACDVYNQSLWNEKFWSNEALTLPYLLRGKLALEGDGYRVDKAINFAGIPYRSLASANDSGHYDFMAIAAALRDYYGFPPREVTHGTESG